MAKYIYREDKNSGIMKLENMDNVVLLSIIEYKN